MRGFNPYETEPCINAICGNYNSMMEDISVDPLLIIPVFLHDFLCIHPFNDDDVLIGTSQLTQAKSRVALICPNFLSSWMGYERGRRRKQSYLQTKVGWECAAA